MTRLKKIWQGTHPATASSSMCIGCSLELRHISTASKSLSLGVGHSQAAQSSPRGSSPWRIEVSAHKINFKQGRWKWDLHTFIIVSTNSTSLPVGPNSYSLTSLLPFVRARSAHMIRCWWLKCWSRAKNNGKRLKSKPLIAASWAQWENVAFASPTPMQHRCQACTGNRCCAWCFTLSQSNPWTKKSSVATKAWTSKTQGFFENWTHGTFSICPPHGSRSLESPGRELPQIARFTVLLIPHLHRLALYSSLIFIDFRHIQYTIYYTDYTCILYRLSLHHVASRFSKEFV